MCVRWTLLSLLSLMVALASQLAIAEEPPRDAKPDAQALQQRATDLVRMIADLEQELLRVRRELAKISPRRGVTPQEAVEQFKRFPKEPMTVEFGVERIGYPDSPIRDGDDKEPAIVAKWDNYLVGGGTMTAIIPPKVYRQLVLPTKDGGKVALSPGQERKQVARHIEEHGIRVTGVLEPGGINNDQYVIRVNEPEDVVLYIKGSGM
jgi:hypothetical protein